MRALPTRRGTRSSTWARVLGAGAIALLVPACGGSSDDPAPTDDAGAGNDTASHTDTGTGPTSDSAGTDTNGGPRDTAVDPDAPKTDSGGPGTDTGGDAAPSDGGPGTIWHPTPGTSWQWQISGTIDTTVDAKVFDIDLFDSTDAIISDLHAKGRKVICYFDTAYEPGRPDSSRFTAAVLGNPIKGWPGQKWVDVRSDVVKTIMTDRMDLAVKKHCEGVEPDDVDGYTNDPGFPITAADNLVFLRFSRRRRTRAVSPSA